MNIKSIMVVKEGLKKVFHVLEKDGTINVLLPSRSITCHCDGSVAYMHLFDHLRINKILERRENITIVSNDREYSYGVVSRLHRHVSGVKSAVLFLE